MIFHVPNEFRVRRGPMRSDDANDNNGAFLIPHPNKASSLVFSVVASDGEGWEHVSISLKARCPTWEEMCYFKHLFWGPEPMVVQYHPPDTSYINNHAHCLHLWRPIGTGFPHPPDWMV